ncbi:MAG: 50S ribosomal protein L24 [Bacteriovoracaceae bacterium]|jgi:large subunit ribosomal protein L24|nr:50S ribosomal protein L24 [Halobacteriovoraceae bacterium]MDP7321745.1 50S ribosomal protein L24 [Bacteriovoracaceae bacterium]|tara:strand:- start:773 stop:1084 length:312 start_codon:yes stop_codon:yes gene_type:complete
MQKLKINDEVIVLAGKDKNKKGKLTNINLKKKTVIVDGLNRVKKAVKPTQEDPNGGFADVEKPMHVSNVAVVSPKTGKATRVRIEDKDGKKVRVAVSCGSTLS